MIKIKKIRISNNTMEKKDFFAPLSLGLGATRRAACVLITLVMAFAGVQTAFAAVGDVVDSGTCGTNLTWTLTDNGGAVTFSDGDYSALTLTITGTGAMYDYTSSTSPWREADNIRYRITTLNLPEGITHIGNHAFYFTNYSGPLVIPSTVKTIGASGFYAFYGATSVTIPASVTSIGENGLWGFGHDASSCTVTFAEGSQLSSIGAKAFYGVNADLNMTKCTKLTAITAEEVFRAYTKTVTFPKTLTSVCANAFRGKDRPTVKLAYQGFLVINGEFQSYNANGAVRTITSKFNIASGSKAVTIFQRSDGLTHNTEGSYYEVNSEQGLVNLGDLIEADKSNTIAGMTFKLTADLDFTNMPTRSVNGNSGNFHPIGLVEDASFDGRFSGHFDGQNHTIKALRYTNKLSSGSNNNAPVGLFKKVDGSNAVVERVLLIDPQMSGKLSGCGGIAGLIYNGATIRNCTVLGGSIVRNGGKSGGIVGSNSDGGAATIEGCTVIGTSVENGMIIGYANSQQTIKDCIYYAPDGKRICSDNYTDGGGNQRVYQVTLGENVTASGATYTHALLPGKAYYAEGATVTLDHDREGYVFLGYTATGVTLSGSATSFTMPASDVTIGTEWADPADISVNAAGTEYTIHTATGWNVFCDCLDDNDTYNRFSGKTVKLGNDIGTAQDPITRMAGSSKHDFCGTFDGDGHTLTVNISSDDITDGSTQYVAPFRYVSNTKADPSDEADSPAAFRNLHVTGTITTDKQFTGGLIGGCWGTVIVENCRVSTAITSTISGDGTHGGIVGIQQNDGTLYIRGTVFDGSLLGESTNCVGGFLGYRKSAAEIRNSLFAPAEVTVLNTSGATFARNKVDTYNSYYTYYLCDGTNYAPYDPAEADHPDKYNNGKAAHRITAGENVTIDGLGAGTEYNVSGITAYGTGIKYGSNLYAGDGDEVSLTLANTTPAGYQYGYSASAGTLDGTTLTMSDADVTITVGLSVIDWATESDGDADHPYMIYNKDQLDLLAQRVNGGTVAYDKVIEDDGAYFYCYYSDKYFKLMNDITYSHTTDWFSNYNSTENNYEAIGCYYSYGNYRVFNGHFDGAGHTISGIRIYKGGSDDVDSYQGIFGITNSADIHDLTLADACITGYLSTGGIVGATGGTITRCHVANNVAINSVIDASGHGGIVGYNNGGTVSHCTSAVKLYHKLNSDYCLGGIAGGNDGTLTDNLVIGATIPTNNDKAYGAITGGHVGGTLEHNYYTACNVAGTPNAAGVGRCLFEHGIKFTIADVTEDDGAVPALRDGADNTYALSLFAAIPATLDLGWGAGKYPVQLTGRTLYKDGDWNTLCLPFAMTAEQVAASALAGATLMELDTDAGSYGHVTGLDNGTLYLNFKDATSIEAGKPYLIKWAKANDYVDDNAHNIVNPVFSGVTIDNTDRSVTSSDGYVTFKGTYDRKVWNEESQSILFVGAGNTLYWPQPSNNQTPYLNACRAYFQLNNGLTAAEVSAARMNFEDDATGISDALRLNDKGQMTNDNFYDLQGRKIEKPTKGLYIHNGKKVIIK